jgi:hypothetical protein
VNTRARQRVVKPRNVFIFFLIFFEKSKVYAKPHKKLDKVGKLWAIQQEIIINWEEKIIFRPLPWSTNLGEFLFYNISFLVCSDTFQRE